MFYAHRLDSCRRWCTCGAGNIDTCSCWSARCCTVGSWCMVGTGSFAGCSGGKNPVTDRWLTYSYWTNWSCCSRNRPCPPRWTRRRNRRRTASTQTTFFPYKSAAFRWAYNVIYIYILLITAYEYIISLTNNGVKPMEKIWFFFLIFHYTKFWATIFEQRRDLICDAVSYQVYHS